MKFKHEVKVGIFLLISMSILIYAIMWLNKFEFGTHLQLNAKFKDVGTLNTGSTVLYRGVYCGKVEDIVLSDDSEYAIVKINITNKSIHILQGSTAAVLDKGFTGTKVLTINPPDKPLITNYLQDGDTIEGKQSFTIEEFQKLLTRKSQDGTLESMIDNSNNLLINTNKLTVKLDKLLVKLEAFEKGEHKNLLTEIRQLCNNMNTTSIMLNNLMGNKTIGKDVMATINKTYKAMYSLDNIANQTSGFIDKSGNTIDKIDHTVTTINQSLDNQELGQKVTGSIDDLSTVLKSLKEITNDKDLSNNIKNFIKTTNTNLTSINCMTTELSDTLSKRFLLPKMIFGTPGKNLKRCTYPENTTQEESTEKNQ